MAAFSLCLQAKQNKISSDRKIRKQLSLGVRMLRWTAAVSLVLFISLPISAQARELALEQVWHIIAAQSKSQQASKLELQAATLGKVRASRHWLPQVYVDARSYETNDPTLSFMGTLDQRAVTTADFEPDSLNHPGSHLYTRGALGVDWPIYEGGSKTAQLTMQNHVVASKCGELVHTQVALYAEVARLYGRVQGLIDQRKELQDLRTQLSLVLENYHLGEKANSFGYSGLLGLKNLANRLDGLLAQNRAEEFASKDALSQLGLHQTSWAPQKLPTLVFVDRYFPVSHQFESAKLLSQKEMALAMRSRAAIERAKLLPKVGAFAEEYVFNGDRSTASGYSAGVYLRWNFINPEDHGKASEAALNASAADSQVAAIAQQDRAQALGLSGTILAIRNNLQLMQQSEKLLSEQTRVTSSLYKNGAINVLQLVEVFSRRTDLIESHTNAVLELLNLNAQRATKMDFKLPGKMA